MNKLIIMLLILALLFILFVAPVSAQFISKSEATKAAYNWITLTSRFKSDHTRFVNAELGELQELERDGKLIGYFFQIKPRGYIVVALRKELTPIKFFSVSDYIDPDCEIEMVDLIKKRQLYIRQVIEDSIGPIESADPAKTRKLFNNSDYGEMWQRLTVDTAVFESQINNWLGRDDYDEGDVLLTSSWHQREPYNDQCPDMGCNWYCNSNNNARVGCVATAAAQIMNYWKWPPYGRGAPYDDPYDWINMPDNFLGCVWDPDEVDAVSELCHEIGVCVGMDYGCGGSGAATDDMDDVYNTQFVYTNPNIAYLLYTPVQEWIELLISQFNDNRPVHYGMHGHSFVADGWLITGETLYWHVNMGWGGSTNVECSEWDSYTSSNTWIACDDIPCSNQMFEYVLTRIVPEGNLENELSGTYPIPDPTMIPFRYFNRDAHTTGNTTFESGQGLQFLPNVEVSAVNGYTIRFEGQTADPILLFTKGDRTRGIEIKNGGVVEVLSGNAIKLY